MTVPVSLLVDATSSSPGLDAQLHALAAAIEGTPHELVIVGAPEATGRRDALARAAGRARHAVGIAVGPLATGVDAEALDALGAAVAGGAGLAAPVLATPAGPVHGYAAADDGRLLPLGPDAGAADALGLDCLAAPRAFWMGALPELDPLAGPYETQVAEAAAPFGPLEVVRVAIVERAAHGPALSVIVCTRDRADELDACVEGLVAHGALADGGEIILVDSASDDATPAVCARLAAEHPGIVTVRDEAGGLSRARNAGAAVARNEVLAFIDDDARPAPGWVESLRDVFADPNVAVGGGPVHGLWPDAPAWRPPSGWEPYYSVMARGDAGLRTELGDFYGTNWAVRRDVLDAIGGFDERWGAGAYGSLPGEETAAEHAVRDRGLGVCGYAPGAAIGHRIDPARLDESWLLGRVFRHGLILPHVAAAFREPDATRLQADAQSAAQALHAAGVATAGGDLDVAAVLDRIGTAPRPLDARLREARHLGTIVRAVWLMGARECTIGALRIVIGEDDVAGRLPRPVAVRGPAAPRSFTLVENQPVPRLRILAIVPVFNEVDVIRPVVESLIAEGCDVYVLDNRSTDGSPEALADLVGRGVVEIESFPDAAGYDPRNAHQFVLADQLRRLSEIAAEQDAYDWFIVADADEFRESPFPDTTLAEGLGIAHAAGYSAVQFELYDFRPIDDDFVPGTDVREHLRHWEPPRSFDVGQIKAWRNPGVPVDLSLLHSRGARFPGRRVFPIPFILRHYALRGETHGRQKVFRDRMPRFAPEERASRWHVQYDALAEGTQQFLWRPEDLREWDGDAVRAALLARATQRLLIATMASDVDVHDDAPSAAALAGFLGRTVFDAAPDEALVADALRQLPMVSEGADPAPGTERAVLAAVAVRAAQHSAVGVPVAAARLQPIAARLGELTDAATGRFTAVAFADELVADPGLLRDYGAAFGAGDDATLVIVMDGTDVAALAAVVEDAGLAGDDSPDLLATDVVPENVRALYTRRADGRLAALPRLADPAALRALAVAA